jgi:hypothetical protein
MMPEHYLSFNNNFFDLEQTTIYGIFGEYGHMSWDIEIYPADEENYIMFNSLIFDKVFSPAQLSNLKYRHTNRSADLYGHTVSVEGGDRFLKSVNIKFGIWDAAN